MCPNRSASGESAPFPVIVPTAGRILDDGSLLELIEDPSLPRALALLRWDGQDLELGFQIECAGQLYIPLTLPPSVRAALRLPSSCAPGGTTAQLFARLVGVFEKFTDLAEHARQLVVAFVFASWIPDFISVPVTLFVWAPDPAAGAQVLQVLSALCRQALAVSGADARDLRALPDDLPATLLLFRPASSPRSRELLAATGWRGFRTLRQGRLVETVGARAIASDTPLSDAAILGPTYVVHVSANRHPSPTLDKRTLEELANEFMPELLRFRLQHRQTVVRKEPVETSPGSPARSLISALNVCFGDEPELEETVSLLIEASQNGHETGRADPRVQLLEVLRARCHEEGRDKLYVAEIALDLNARILANGGRVELGDRMVGSILKSLGLITCKLDRRGRGLVLDTPTRERIHSLARGHDVPEADVAFPGCVECAHAQSTAT